MNRSFQILALILGVVLGYGAAIVVTTPEPVEPAATPGPGLEREAIRPGSTTTTTEVPDTAEPSYTTYLVWSTGGLPEGFGAALTSRFERVSVVRGDVVELSTGDGFVVPLDAATIDREDHRPFDPGGALQALVPGMVSLGESSAELRGLSVGDSLEVGEVTYQVASIAPDDVIAAAEVVFTQADPAAPVLTERYVLVETNLPRDVFEEFVRSAYDGPAPLRIRAEGETPWLRHGDAVLPQVFIKEALGEFSYAATSGSNLIQNDEFVTANIVTVEVPILGDVTCHRVVAEMLREAMEQLVDEGLSHLVDPAGFAGCWNPRFIRSITGAPTGVSRHSWGAALDINARANPLGSVGSQDPRLIEVMLEWGFTWGGDWLVPDPMHFEYGIPPG